MSYNSSAYNSFSCICLGASKLYREEFIELDTLPRAFIVTLTFVHLSHKMSLDFSSLSDIK